MATGFDAHLVKPVDSAALLELLARLSAERCQPIKERESLLDPAGAQGEALISADHRG